MKKVVWKTRFKGENCLFLESRTTCFSGYFNYSTRRNELSDEKNYEEKAIITSTHEKFL